MNSRVVAAGNSDSIKHNAIQMIIAATLIVVTVALAIAMPQINGTRSASVAPGATSHLAISPVEEPQRFAGIRINPVPARLEVAAVEEAARFQGLRAIALPLTVAGVEEAQRFQGLRATSVPARLQVSPVEEAQRFSAEWVRWYQGDNQD